MRIRMMLVLGSVTGLLVITVSWPAPLDGVTLLYASAVGALLGGGAAAYILAASRWPRRTTALLLAFAPALSLIAADTGIATLNRFPALLAFPLLITLLRRGRTRRALRIDPLTVAVSGFAVAAVPSALISDSLIQALTRLLPLSLFFIGMLLQSGPRGIPSGMERARLLRLLAPALLCGGVLLALLALLFPPSAAGARTTALLLGALVLLAISWDSRRFFWQVVLGHPQRSVRAGALLLGIVYLTISGIVLIRLATPGIVVALMLALVVVSIVRRRFSEIALLIISFMPLMNGFGWDWLKAPLLSLSVGFNASAWSAALSLGATTPFGVGFQQQHGFGMYQRILAATGICGLAALALALVLTLISCAQAYTRLRPISGEAGGMLAAGGLCLFIIVAGFFSDPLSSPSLAMVIWLFIGMANGTIEAMHRVTSKAPTKQEQALFSRLRGYPLRIAYVLPGDDASDAAFAFSDYLHSFDHKRVKPLMVAVGPGPLVSLARGMGVDVRVVRSSPRLRRQRFTREESRFWSSQLGTLLSVVGYSLDLRRWTLRRSAHLVQAALALEPDLLVSLDPALHLVTLTAGRISGIPVQWHSHEIASAGVQRALDTLAPWTVGILAASQTIAHAFSTRIARTYVKVLRPSVLIERTALPDRAIVRQQLGIPQDAHLLSVIGPIAAKSGHQDVIDALLLLQKSGAHTRTLIFDEAPPQAMLGDARPPAARGRAKVAEATTEASWQIARLRKAIAASGLEDAVTLLGPRADALALLAASDVLIFPQERPTGSRNLLLGLASGTPLVATRTGSHDELLRDAWGYLLIKPHDAEGLATSIMGVLQQLDLYRTNARRNPTLVRDWFSPAVETGRLVRIYSDVCQPEGQTLRLPTRERITARPRHWVTALWAAQPAD